MDALDNALLDAVPSLPAAEREQVLYRWNNTQLNYPRDATLHELFAAQARRTPARTAVTFENQSLTYAELDARSTHLASHLRTLGVGPESLVGFYVHRSLDMVVGLLGILKAGGAYIPIDPDFPGARIRLMLEDAQPGVIVTQAALLDSSPIDAGVTVCLDRLDDTTDAERGAAEDSDSAAGPQNLAYVIYTSGSTGRPKGVQITHRAAVNFLTSMQRTPGLTASDRVLAVTTLSFDIALLELFLPLITGAQVVIVPRETAVDGVQLQQLLNEADITLMQATPATWRLLLDTGWNGKPDLTILCGGEAMSLDLAEKLLPRCRALWNMYGPTETTVWSTVCPITTAADAISIGSPIANTQVYLLDEARQPVAIGAVGRLHIGGDGVARGYLNRPALTAERFIANPFATHGSDIAPVMYNTGDLARYLPDGRIEFLGRNDFQVKIRGFRVELGDVETAVNQHPAVSYSLAMAREDTPGVRRLVSYLIPARDKQIPDARELRDFLRQTLPDYMVPERFVIMERFPLLPNGKIDRRALPAPDRAGSDLKSTLLAPRSELEQHVAGLCAEVLNLERIGLHDSFFDLGGNSLLAARFLFKVQEQFALNVPLRTFLEQPTVLGVSQFVADAQVAGRGRDGRFPTPTPHAEAPPVDGDVDADLLAQSNLTRGQFLMWMGQKIHPDAPLYNVVNAYAIHGELDVGAFRRAFQALVDRHDALRTLIVGVNGVPQQQVQPRTAARLDLVDFSTYATPERDYAAWLDERKVRVPRLDQQPYDAALVKLAPDHFIWYFCQHHILTDAASAELLFKRLAEGYRLARDNRLDGLPHPPQYADFVHSERMFRQTRTFRQAADYWREKCSAPLPPTDFYGKSTGSDSLRIERVLGSLGPERSEGLRKIARLNNFVSPSEDMSLFTVFAALLLTTLHRINGERTLRLGTPFHGRPTAATQDIAGLFLEMGVMQVEIEDDETFVSLGEKVMAETFDGLTHLQPGISSADTNRAYDVVLNYIQAAFRNFAGFPVTRVPVDSGYIDTNHSLRLQVLDLDATGSFQLAFDMKHDIFGAAEQTWLVEQFLRVVDAFIANYRRPLGDFSLLTAAQRQNLLLDFNATDAPYPIDRTVTELFEEQAAAAPDAVAAMQDGVTLTYAALNARANRLTHYLRASGVGPETAVAICMQRSIDVLIAILGVLKAGGAYIPIDPAYPAARIRYMLADAKPTVLLTHDAVSLPQGMSPTDTQVVNLASLDLTDGNDSNPLLAAEPDNLVYMIYTSGSTGKPKGTMLTHRGLVNYVWWARRTYQQGDALDFPLYSSLAFDLTVTSIFVPLLSGGKVVVYREAQDTPGLEILSVFREDAVDVVKLTPAHLGLVRELNLTPRRIRKLIVGGEDFKTELARAIHDLFGGKVDIYNEYGPTEAVVGCMIHRYNPERDTAVSVPIGTPAANARIYLLDEYDQPVPPGVIGEMVISSDGVARGYHQRPKLTAERFGSDPFRPGARIYRSGDIARWNARDQMVFLGRRDYQVKINSARIELGEIEAQLLTHDAIQDVIVRAVTFEPQSEADEIIHCARCGLPSNYPNVSFNGDGVCNLCTDFDTFREDVFRYFKTMDDLHAIVARARAERTGDYDCMMLYSGGKDSTYVLSQLVEMGLKVLAFSLDNGYISEEAKDNMRRVTEHLGVDLVLATTPHMNAIFADSLERYSNVCQGCYKTIYTLSMTLARKKGIKYIFTGLSRGQLFETRLDELFRNRIFDVARMDEAVVEARKVYHRVDDAVHRLLDVSLFSDDCVFGEIQFVDYFRYTAELSEARRALLLKRLQGKKTEPESSSGIERRRQSGPLPLSYAQQRVWFLQQLFPDNRAYNMHEAWRVRGPLDVEALRLALNAVARQQASLRTRFVAVNDEPMQLVADEIELPLPVIDISHLPPAQRGAKLLDLIWTEGNYVFDLSTGPLVCMSLVRLGYEEHALLLTLHHIITDEWSNDVFWRELNAGYAHAQQAGAVTLREPPIQYGDYAQWQREQVTSGALKEQSAYWQTQLSGDLPLLQLPFDRPRASTQSLKGGLLWRRLSPDLLAGMQALSQRAGATLYMTLLAAFQALLHRYSSQDDILVGTPIANRQRLETKNVMGMFINTAVMRADFSGSPNFLQLLDQVRQTALDALANQDFPFDLLVQSMHPNRDLSHNPLFQTMFVYLSNEVERGLPDTQFEPIEVDHGVAKFDLTMFAGEENSCLTLALEYNSDLFDEATAVRMLDHFQTLLQAIVEDPHAPIAALPLLSPKEQTLVLESWNETAVPFTETRCLHALIDARAAQHPDAVAVIAQDQRLTYDQLVRRANGLAHALVARGVGPGTPVGLFVERSAEMLVGILGILKAGGAYVPLEPGYPSERIAFALADTAAPLIVTQAQLTGQLPPTDAAVVVLDAEDPGSDTPPETAVTLDHLAYTIYTSGSTGTPKGVMVTHRNLLSSTLARSAYYDAPVQRYLLLSSFAFDSSVAGLFWTLADGGALVLPAPDEEKDVPRLAGLVAQEQVTHTLALPTLYRLLLTYAPDSALSSLQVVIVAGEACPLDLGRLHYDRLPRSTLYNEYGPTEATVWCSVYRVPPSSDGRSVPIGRPIANTQLYILDGQCQPVPIGVPGELYVGGSGVTPGYLNRPALTAERFIPDRFSPPGKQSGAAALYRTGDLARWRPDGEIEFLGRVDNQVKIRGFRIEPGEIEAALVEHPAVQEAAVAVWEVDSGKRLAAYVVGDAARAKSVQLQSYLGERLPDYMVPRQITFLPALPRTPNGKVDRSQLPRPFPETDRERPFVPPRSPAEKTLARLWCEVLQLPQVSVEDKFFDLGGDSIMSIQVVARARQEGLILTPRQMFREQTIARLAAVATVAGEPVAPQTDVSGPVPLTPIQHWFFEQQLANPNHWNQAEWFETAADLDANTLRAALGFLSQQHPILRARFRLVDGVWQQKILPSAPLPALEHISLTGLDPAAQDATMLAEANRLHAGLDLVDGPLVGGALFTLGTGRRPRLLLVIHHLVIDAVSWGTITANLQTAYRQLAVGEPVSLPAPTAGYAQWATLLTKLAQDDALRRELDYWRQIGATQTALPTDGPGNGRDTEGQSELLTVTLDSRRTHSLLRDVHQTYHTRIEDVLLTALARAMTSWTNTPSLLLTLEHHGREELDAQLDVSQTVGWFTSLFPIRLELGELTDVGANLRAVKEQLRSVPQNGVGYGILRYLGDEAVRRQLASQPGPQILFNYLGEGGSMARQDGLLRPLPADIGQAYGPQNARAHLIDINARVENGRFTAVWQYDASRFANATIQRVADAYIAELARLVDHCLSIEQDQHTPSDFPLANLEQADLDSLSDLLAELD